MRIAKGIVAATALALLVVTPATASPKKGTGRLVPSDVVVSPHVDNGYWADVSFSVTNRSAHAQRSRRAQLSLVDDSSKARRLGNVSLPRLAGGATTDQSVSRLVRNATPAGTYRAQVCVRSQSKLRCATSELVIQIAPPELQADPNPVDLGDVVLGQSSAPVDVKITNEGGIKSGVPSLAVSGTDAGDFAIVGDDCDAALLAGQFCTATLRFTPGAAGARSASLDVAGGDPSLSVPLEGTGLKPADLQVTPSSNDFGKVLIGTVSASKTFTVTNVGESPSTALNATTTDNQFGIPLPSDDCSTVVLGAGQSCTVDVDFEPGAHGDQSGSLEVSATKGGTATATLNGFGGDPAKLEITPNPYDFGKVLINTDSAPKTFTVKNTGDFPTSMISTVGIDGAGMKGVTNDACFGTSLNPGDTCTLDVVARPPTHGELTGTVYAMATVGGSGTSALSVFGADPAKIVLTPDTFDFGNVVVGGTITKKFTATNTGDLPPGGLAYGNMINGYGITTSCTVAALTPGGSCDVTVSFTPASTGTKTTSIRMIDTDQGFNSGVPAEVTGNGVATDANLVFNPLTRAYNPIPGGGTFSTPVYIQNTGEADAHGLTFEPGTDSTPNVFSVSFESGIPNGWGGPACGSVIPGGVTCSGFMIWKTNTPDNPTKASIKVTGLPGGSSQFVATFGGP